MCKNLLVIALVSVTLASCSKDKDQDNSVTPPVYSLSTKIDGVSQAFNTDLTAAKTGDATNGYTVLVIGTAGSNSNPFPNFTLSVHSDVPIVTTTYFASNNEASGVYRAADQTTYVGASEFMIKISTITATDVSGTFSGKVDNGSGVLKTISEGTFSAKFF